MSLIRINPIPCKFCGELFSGKSYSRFNCDKHYRMKLPEVEELRAKRISKTKTGTKRPKFSKEWIEHLRASAQRGEKSYRWKGGVTPIHETIRKSARYIEWRKKVFKRDNYTCQFCWKRGRGTIHADHIKPFSLFPELRFELTNGRTLCVDCHRKTDTYGDLRNYVVKSN